MTPKTDNIRKRVQDGNYDLGDILDSYEELESAANKLHDRLQIWVNTAGACGSSSLKDVEALVGFEILEK